MPKRILEGVVVSDKGEKTVVVKVERTLLHPLLKKTVRSSKKYHAHDEANALKVGDIVGPFAVDGGWAILKVEDKRLEQPITFEAARPQPVAGEPFERSARWIS